MKYFIKIFGCQMNQSDAERIATYLEKYKIKPAASIDAADLIMFVTCGVRQSAEDRVYGQINNLYKKYPKKKIILTGCLAHRKDVQRRLYGKVNLFTTIKDFPNKFKKISRRSGTPLRRWLNTKYQILVTKNKLCKDYLEIIPKHSNHYTAYIPIMTGCNNFCAYCVVPYARGREYSRPAEDILREVKNLVKKGCREIVLLGQNVNSYCHPERSRGICVDNPMTGQLLRHTDSSTRPDKSGLGRNDKIINFPKLIHLIEKIPGKFWLIFLTSHPKDMSDELIETIAKSKKICEYISLPAQSGDNEILKKMNRHYTVEHYKNLIAKIRSSFQKYKSKIIPSISTDIIVGFPGETKKQFENTAKLLRELKFDMAYIAQYSPRPETAAWKMEDNISKKEKVRREKVLTDILSKTALENNKKYVGKTVEVLVDADLSLRAKRSNPVQTEKLGSPRSLRSLAMTMCTAHTRAQKKVIFHSDKKIPVGSFVKVKITKVKAFGLEGKIL